jgi:hypothetical protein
MESQHRERFERTVDRLIRETFNLMADNACLEALVEILSGSDNLFTLQTEQAFQGDRLIRLIRILEETPRVKSFWYLHRCEPSKVAQGVDIAKLRDLSQRIKKVRNSSFVHIDKHAVVDSQKIYRDVDIKISEISYAIETVWEVLNRLYRELHGSPFPNANITRTSLNTTMKDELLKLISSGARVDRQCD